MRVTFTGMAFGGEAVARDEGKAIFVPLAMPGDEADVEIVEEHGRFARGRIRQLLRPAPERITPRCKHFGVCGGCQWQHIAYARQLEFKSQIVREQLTRIGGLAEPRVQPTIPCSADDPWHYRNNTQFHLSRDGRLGYMALRSHAVIPIEECHILEPPVWDLWRALDLALPDLDEVMLRAGIHSGERMLVFYLDGDEAPQAEIDVPVNAVVELRDGSEHVLAGERFFHERLHDDEFQVSATSFFQVNTRMAERLVELVCQAAGRSGAVLDAYCGVGTFTLALARQAGRVTGIESAAEAARDARVNTRACANVEILEGTVEAVLPRLNEHFDVLVLDPPREGCAPAVSAAISARQIPRIVYVSCDPSTLARDVKRLAAGGYRLVEAQPLDMFPQTFHIETVATLELGR